MRTTVGRMTLEQEIDLLWACYDEANELGQTEAAAEFAKEAMEKVFTLPQNAVYLQTVQ